MSKDKELYKDQVTFLEQNIGQEDDSEDRDWRDEHWNDLPEDLKQAMREYFFAGREVDVEDVVDYRKKLMMKNPEIKAKAEKGLKMFLDKIFIDDNDIKKNLLKSIK